MHIVFAHRLRHRRPSPGVSSVTRRQEERTVTSCGVDAHRENSALEKTRAMVRWVSLELTTPILLPLEEMNAPLLQWTKTRNSDSVKNIVQVSSTRGQVERFRDPTANSSTTQEVSTVEHHGAITGLVPFQCVPHGRTQAATSNIYKYEAIKKERSPQVERQQRSDSRQELKRLLGHLPQEWLECWPSSLQRRTRQPRILNRSE